MFSAMLCNTASGLEGLDLTALCLAAAAFRAPLPASTVVADLSTSVWRCCRLATLRSSSSVDASARASEACCHLLLMPLRACSSCATTPAGYEEDNCLGSRPQPDQGGLRDCDFASVTLGSPW